MPLCALVSGLVAELLGAAALELLLGAVLLCALVLGLVALELVELLCALMSELLVELALLLEGSSRCARHFRAHLCVLRSEASQRGESQV